LGEAAGFKFWKPLVWDKLKIGMGYHYRARYELILFFEKGKRNLSNLALPDIIQVPRIHNGYPAEKPVQLAAMLIAQSTLPGEVVLDPFMGSGTTGVAALDLGRNFYGIDICKEAVGVARQRLAKSGANEKEPIAVLRRRWPFAPNGSSEPSKRKGDAQDRSPTAR